MKKICCLLLIILIAFNLTGCWDSDELNELGIIMGIAIDKDTTSGKVIITSEIVNPSSLSKQSPSGKSTIEYVTTDGNTVTEAINATTKEFDRKNLLSHIKVFVISEEVARCGVNDIVDFIARSNDIRRFTSFVVAKGSSAREILGVNGGIDKIQANYMSSIIKEQITNLDVAAPNFFDFLKKMPGDRINPVAGVFGIVMKNNLPAEQKSNSIDKVDKLIGAAAFKKDKLVGFLDYSETRGYNFIIDDNHKGIYNIPSSKQDNKYLSIYMEKFRTKITPFYINAHISYNIDVKLEASIVQVSDASDVSNLKEFNDLNYTVSEYVEKDIKKTLSKIQKELKTDILGFGGCFYRKYPKEWKIIKNQWNDLFPTVNVSVKVKTKLKRTGLLLKPLDGVKENKIDFK